MTGDCEIERLREKARHDEAQALYHAEHQGIQKGASGRNIEIARTMIAYGESVEKIKRYTGLTSEEIQGLSI